MALYACTDPEFNFPGATRKISAVANQCKKVAGCARRRLWIRLSATHCRVRRYNAQLSSRIFPMSNAPKFGLNGPQSEAVLYLDGPCLVLAGAGSGKTRVITQKIAYMIEDRGYDPRTIAALTFTNKAALEMQERIAKLLKQPKQAKQLTVSTFHSLGVKILRQEAAGV